MTNALLQEESREGPQVWHLKAYLVPEPHLPAWHPTQHPNKHSSQQSLGGSASGLTVWTASITSFEYKA